MGTYVRNHVEATKIVWSMNVAFVVFVGLFVIMMQPVVEVRFVRIVCVKMDVGVILYAQQIRLVSIINVQVSDILE